MSNPDAQSMSGLLYDFKKAWLRNELEVYLQPQIYADNRQIAGFEALIRWRHPTKGIILPAVFLPLAQELNMMEKLDYFVFDKVCAFLAKRQKDGKSLFCISANFEREHFYDPAFVPTLEKIRRKYDVSTQYLSVEMLEGSFFSSTKQVKTNLKILRRLGYGVYLDDCGSNESNISDLMFEDVTHVKLDRSVVQNLHKDHVRLLLTGLCETMHRMSYKVVYEGVETFEQLQLAKEIGVDIVQGFYFYRPMNLLRAEILYDLN